MRNSIILPLNYEKVFMMESRKSGLIKHIEFDEEFDSSNLDAFEDDIYKRKTKVRQNLFQMILLYDELILQDTDPTYDYSKIKDLGNFKIYPFEEFYYFNAINQENNSIYAEYLKPAIINYIKKELKSYFIITNDDKKTYNELISELYDFIFGIKSGLTKETISLLELNEFAYKLRHRKNIHIMKELNAPVELTDRRFWTELVNWFFTFYEHLCWQLKISSEQQSYIVNSEFQLSKIGCDIYEENINTYMDAYKILKCECSQIIGTLPHMDSIEDALSLKEKRKNDIKNLRDVIDNLENTIRNEGREVAIAKATKDVTKASLALSKCESVNKVGKWTTLLSVPVGIAEMLFGGGIGGFGLSVVGTATCLIDEKIKRNNSWCEIVR